MVSQVSQHIQSGRVVQAVSDAYLSQSALDILPLTHEEASVLMAEEAKRTLALFASLSGDDWTQPTACTRWNVFQVASHLVGESAGYASWREFYRLYLNIFNKQRYFREKMPLIDALNQQMVDDRAGRTTAELIADLRDAAPKAIQTRLRLPAMLRALRLPLPLLGTVRIDYLTDMIYPRDTWMHRVDISRAVGRAMVFDATHDARIIALAIRDLALYLTPLLDGKSIELILDTLAGGTWHVGANPVVAARIEVGLIDFMLLASGRVKAEQTIAQAVITGDRALGVQALEKTTVPF